MTEIEYLRLKAKNLLDRANKLEEGKELCDHHWSGDPGWECYCTGCGEHILEARSKAEIPFKDDAYCVQCEKTEEEKQAEIIEMERIQRDSDLKTLSRLKNKYPDEWKSMVIENGPKN